MVFFRATVAGARHQVVREEGWGLNPRSEEGRLDFYICGRRHGVCVPGSEGEGQGPDLKEEAECPASQNTIARLPFSFKTLP